jgi:hypothetical protein
VTMRIVLPVGLGLMTAFALGCSGGGSSSDSGSTSPLNAAKPSTAVTAVSAAVATAGTSMGSSGISAAFAGNSVFHPYDISQDCSIHAEPERSGSPLTNSDPDYAGKFMYCKLAYNTQDPESVQGAMAQLKSISCMLENAGLLWDGASHSYTMVADTSCWSQQQLTNMGGSGQTLTITATASMPASFNTYYERGISMTIPSLGDMTIATNISDSKVEFTASETNAPHNKFDAYSATLDYVAGEVRYELRSDRFDDTVDSSSGGFSRHQRIYAKVTNSGTTVTGLTSISAAQVETYNGAVQGGYGGQAVTASGTTAGGIKARYFDPNASSPASKADLEKASNWVETTNTRCYTSATANGLGCTTGIAIPTSSSADSFHFALIGTHTASDTWANARGAWTFTVVDPGVDVQ